MKSLFGASSFGSLAVGAGVVILAPIVLSVIGSVLKPVTKTVIKGGCSAYEGTKRFDLRRSRHSKVWLKKPKTNLSKESGLKIKAWGQLSNSLPFGYKEASIAMNAFL